MTDDDAFRLICEALEKTSEGLSKDVTQTTHLIDDEVIDSLDSMNFLFELEEMLGSKIKSIDETFNDFRVQRLIELLREHAG